MSSSKDIRIFEFLLSMQLVLTLFRDANPEAISEITWLQTFDDYYFLSFGAFLFFLMMSFRHEGSRFSFFLIIFGQLGLYLSRLTNYENHIIVIITTILITVSCFLFYTFPVFKFPSYQGQFNVGVKDILVNDKTEVRIFYPSMVKDRKYIQWMSDKKLKNMFNVMRNCPKPLNIPKFIPYFLFDIVMQVAKKRAFQGYMNAKIINSSEKFPFIIFSHGLAANNSYFSQILGDLASKGCIIVSIQHDDYLPLENVPIFSDWTKLMKPKFEKRVEQFEEIIKFFKKQENINKIFTSAVVELDLNHIVAMGHSFGGATALYSTLKNKDDIYSVILLDPAIGSLIQDEEGKQFLTQNKLEKPALILNSEYFDQKLKELKHFDSIKEYVEINKEFLNAQLTCYMQDTGHENFTDLGLLMPYELQTQKMVGQKQNVPINLILLQKLIEIFLSEMVLSRKNMQELNKNDVITKYQEICTKVKFNMNLVQMNQQNEPKQEKEAEQQETAQQKKDK